MNLKLITGLVLLLHISPARAVEWIDLWLTPDQQGQRLMQQGEFGQAAEKFTTPERIGAALFRAGNFESAASVFGRSSTASADFNRGNSHLMLGDYDAAIAAYQSALTKRPNWPEAEQNLQIANLRKIALARPDDDAGGTGGMLAADEFVFDQTGPANNNSDDQVLEATDQQLGEEALRAMWLRKVETRPADFLAARFNYQLAAKESDSIEPEDETANE